MSNSDLVICKCGYGVITECLTSGVPFYYIMDDEHVEQKSISRELERMGLTNRITLSDINDIILSYDKLESLKSLHKPNDVNNTVNKLIEFIKN